MSVQLPRAIVPERLSSDSTDPRVEGAKRVFSDVIARIQAAGLEPVVVGTHEDSFADADAIVLPGGADIDPHRYGGTPTSTLYGVSPLQDELDFAVAGAALERGVPVLGICRGLQVLNTIYGGTLQEHLLETTVIHSRRRPVDAPADSGPAWAWHDVEVTAGSRLARALGRTTVTVASGHHQGIRTLGDGLTVLATASDGLIEGFEDPLAAVLAVQWHPEANGGDRIAGMAPFVCLADAIRDRQDAR